MKRKVLLINALISKKIVFSALFFLITTGLMAQKGSISGKVIDAQNSEPLIGASVVITGTTNGSATDFDGNYTISNLNPGRYTLTVTYISYKTQTKENVVVEADKPTVVDILLESADISLSEVTVVARANRESENILLMEQRQAILATQAVGAREMSRKGVSDAESAVSKVSGISKQEGVKNVFVRGLGDRYNATYLNGFPIPSEDPEYKNIALDFFSTDVIQSIGVNKVFNGTLMGDVGGAVIDITSKELVGQRAFGIEASAGANFSAIQNDYFIQSGSNYLGFANKSYPSDGTYSFNNSLDPHKAFPLNHGFGISGGKSFKIGDNANPLSFYIVASHSKSYSAVIDEEVRNTTIGGDIWHNQTGKKYSNNTNQLALANVQYGFNKHRLEYNFMMVHANNQYMGQYSGLNSQRFEATPDDSYFGFLMRQQTNDNLLLVNQIMSEWKLNEKLSLNIGGSHNNVSGSEPDRRENYLTRDTDGSYFLNAGDRQKRFFSQLLENDFNFKANLRYALNDKFGKNISALEVGYNGRIVNDRFEAMEFIFRPVEGNYFIENLKLDEAYNQANMDQGKFSMREGYLNQYEVNKYIHSPFAEITYQLTEKLTANAGLKAEKADVNVSYDIEIIGRPGSDKIDKFYLLPSLNLKYDVNDKNSLRLGLSKTYTLPQSKEIAPYQYINISFSSQGNPHLKPSDNYNADLKWDYYISPSELISLTGFYKHIVNPIGRIAVASTAGLLSYENISDFASVAGAELEIRKDLFNFGESIQKSNKLSAGFNFSYIYSNLKLHATNTPVRDTQLEGAAPIIVNFDLSHIYTLNDLNLVNSLVFNYFSDRIHTLGTEGYKDIKETGIPTLNFASSAKVNKNLTLKLKADNLLNSPFQLTRLNAAETENIVLSKFTKGISLSFGIAYDL